MRFVIYWSAGWLAVGAAAGLGTALAWSIAKPADAPAPNPNVVILHAEKTVTIEKPDLTLSALAIELGKQTGYTFTLNERYSKDTSRYAALLRGTPLTRVLAVSGYLAHGKWDRKVRAYYLRPLTAKEEALSVERQDALQQQAYDYLAGIDLKDPTLPENVAGHIGTFREVWETRGGDLPLDTGDMPLNWNINSTPKGLSISYKEQTSDATGACGKSGFRSWSYAHPGKPSDQQ